MLTFTFNGAAFNALAFDGSVGAAPAASTFRESVICALNNITALTAIVGSRIYWGDPSQRAVYPNVCLRLADRARTRNLSGAAGQSTATVEITIQSNAIGGMLQCNAAAQAIYDSLEGFRGYQNSVAWQTCYLEDEPDETSMPVDGNDRWVYAVTVTLRIKHRVPMPANVTQTNV